MRPSAVFARYCAAVARHERAVRMLAEEGEIITGYRGSRVRNPWMLVLSQASDEAKSLGAKFGLTPSDRSQIRVQTTRSSKTGPRGSCPDRHSKKKGEPTTEYVERLAEAIRD